MSDKYQAEKQELIDLATKQQRAASNPDVSVWVEASAGTGKTKVLSDRVLRLLLAKVNPSKILCLTYTKAAAVEMNERISKKLSLWAVEDEDKLKEELSKLLGDDFNKANQTELLNFARTLFAVLLDTPGEMKIQTIHSFCQDILARFPIEAGVSPYFQVLDDRSAKEILQHLKTDLLKTATSLKQEKIGWAVTYLINEVGEYRFPEIMNMITAARGKINSILKKYHNNMQAIIGVLEQKLGVKADMSVMQIQQDFFDEISKNEFLQASQAFLLGTNEDLKRATIFQEISNNKFCADDYLKYRALFITDKNTIRSRLATQKVVKAWPDILSFLNNEAERILKTDNQIAAINVLQATIAVFYIAQNIIEQYEAYKMSYAVLDFEDLIMITRQLLENSHVADWVLFKLDGGIDHILIDEAQDTSPNQWAIVRALTQEFFAGIGSHENMPNRTVFVVGDRKQSIYSFQGADPREFDKMFHYFDERIDDFYKIHLDVSFRSTRAVMDCVNLLFSNAEAKKGVVPLNESVCHRPFRLGDGGKVEIYSLLTEERKKEENKYNWILPIIREQKNSLSNMLAKQIAQNIKSMVDNRELLESKNRPVRYGDFMFLVQRRNAFVEEFIRACKDIGVKVAGIDKLKLLEQIAVQDLISLGKFLLLPDDDLSLAEVLKSPLFNLSDDDLFLLCYQRSGSLFYNLLKNKKYAQTAGDLKTLLNLNGFVRPFELFNFVLSKMNGRQNFISRMGIEVDDILDEFLNLAILFEQQHTPTMQAFISWVVQDEVIIKKEMEQGDSDTVKIMTVHGSKGLQAPIVILGDTTHVKNKAQKSDFLWDENMMYFPTAAANYDDVCKQIKSKILDAESDEYRRLLYVALTRAEDRLYVSGFVKAKEAPEGSWYQLLANNICSNVPVLEENKKIVYVSEQENDVETPALPAKKDVSLLNFDDILTPAPMESLLAKPYAPSHDDTEELDVVASPLKDDGNFYKRGTVIHKLLQYIISIEKSCRFDAALTFLKSQLPEFSLTALKQIAEEVLRLCDTYAEIFTFNSLAEVPIIGEVDGRIISAKMDRLVISDDKVIVVDYKTNRPAADNLQDVPKIYINQLDTYKRLLKKLYPLKEIEAYILWTNTCKMMKV